MSNLGHPAVFRFSRTSDTWTWSEEMFALYGFRPGEVVPSTKLLLSHQHPEDRDAVERTLRSAVDTGTEKALWHRLFDVGGVERQVVTVARGEVGADGCAEGLSGRTVDVSEPIRRAASREVDDALRRISESRPLIEQAKGALMLAYGLDADASFELLRRHSQDRNVKLRDLARSLVDALQTEGGRPTDASGVLDGLVLGSSMVPVRDRAGA
jgi:hypothetical protein